MIKFLKNKKTGFTLIETLIAISIFSVAIVTLMTVLSSGITNINNAKKKITATYLAQEGIEYIRNKRDTEVFLGTTSWGSFITSILPNTPHLDSGFTGFNHYISITTTSNPDEAIITSRVEWTQGSGPKSVEFSENLFNWLP